MPNASTSRLRVTDKGLRLHLGAYDMKSLKWDPRPFSVESPRLELRFLEASVQQESLAAFMEKPRRAMTYIVAGNPDDREARYFAAYLAQIHATAAGIDTNVLWESMTGAFENPAMRESPSLLIVTNLTSRSSNLKFEKTRDLLERHATIPKVLVVAGEDPISFAATRLHAPCHAIAYFGAKTSKTYNEVI